MSISLFSRILQSRKLKTHDLLKVGRLTYLNGRFVITYGTSSRWKTLDSSFKIHFSPLWRASPPSRFFVSFSGRIFRGRCSSPITVGKNERTMRKIGQGRDSSRASLGGVRQQRRRGTMRTPRRTANFVCPFARSPDAENQEA